jgi:hypothetical protein
VISEDERYAIRLAYSDPRIAPDMMYRFAMSVLHVCSSGVLDVGLGMRVTVANYPSVAAAVGGGDAAYRLALQIWRDRPI